MSNIREKAKKVIEKTMQTECVAIERLEFSVPSSNEPVTWVEVDAIVGQECRPMRFHMEWDGEVEDFRRCEFESRGPAKGLLSRFKQEYTDFKLSRMSKQELFALLQKANRRRQRESAKWKKKARWYRDDFIRERDAHAKVCHEFVEYRRQLEQRERILTDREAYFQQWKDNVDELAHREGKRLAYVEHIKRCNECDGRTWHKRYKMKVQGFQEYVTQMLKFVGDVLRDPSIPDIEKARMVDMRNSLIDSRDLLAKELDDKSHLPDEWIGSTKD